jgi:hypothetical protein
MTTWPRETKLFFHDYFTLEWPVMIDSWIVILEPGGRAGRLYTPQPLAGPFWTCPCCLIARASAALGDLMKDETNPVPGA